MHGPGRYTTQAARPDAGSTGSAAATFANNTDVTYAGIFANGATGLGLVSLNKTGTGTLILSGANTHTGGTTVSNGVLELRGSGIIAANTTITVAPGATLRGTNSAADITLAANLVGTGNVEFNPNLGGGQRTVTLSGNNVGFTGTIRQPSLGVKS